MKSQGSGSRCRVQSRGHDGRALERDEYRYRTFLGNKAETCSSRVQPQGMPGVCFRRARQSLALLASCNELELLFCYSRCFYVTEFVSRNGHIFRTIVIIFVKLGFPSSFDKLEYPSGHLWSTCSTSHTCHALNRIRIYIDVCNYSSRFEALWLDSCNV